MALGIFVFATTQRDTPSVPRKDASASALVVAVPSYDFGDIDIFAGVVNAVYTLKNTGTENITIISGQTSCMCTTAEIGDLSFSMQESSGKTVIIPPGTEKTLTVTFDPLAHGPDGVGRIKREVLLTTNSATTPAVEVMFTAHVVKNELP